MNKKVNLENFDIKTKFSIPEQRENLTSGESISNSFGKIEKVIEDLKDVAFSGDYNDLINKPKPGTGGGDANIDDTVIAKDSTWSSDKIHKETAKWIGTQEEFERVKDTLEDNTIVYITDEEEAIIVKNTYSKEELDTKFSNITNTLNNKTSTSDFDTHTSNTDIHVSVEEKNVWNNKSNFSGNYEDLDNKPTIPTNVSELTNDSNYQTNEDITNSLSNYQTKTDDDITADDKNIVSNINILNSSSHTHSNKEILDTITDEKITEWNNKTSVTKVSELTNDANYQTDTQVDSAVSSSMGTIMNTVNPMINSIQENKVDKLEYNTFKNNVSRVLYDESTKTLKLFNGL